MTTDVERIARLEQLVASNEKAFQNYKSDREKAEEEIKTILNRLTEKVSILLQFKNWLIGIFVVIAFFVGIFSDTAVSLLVHSITTDKVTVESSVNVETPE